MGKKHRPNVLFRLFFPILCPLFLQKAGETLRALRRAEDAARAAAAEAERRR